VKPMRELHIMSVVGARPNFMKIAPFIHAIERFNSAATDERISHYLVHTGQHYDQAMSASFFDVLGIPEPDVDLEIGSGTHAEQVGRTMIAFEAVVRERKPDWIVVVGDVNATCACSITAKKEHVQLAHIEAGLRSFDLHMPEEINRMVTDRLSDLLLTPDAMADANLQREGTPVEKICRVGNIMIDTLEANLPKASELDPNAIVAAHRIASDEEAFDPNRFAVMTLHRPSNVDDPEILGRLVAFFTGVVAAELPLVWTVHPRTKKQLAAFGLWDTVAGCRGIHLVEPLSYHEMLRMNCGAQLMLTDSGGLQEECCVTGTPCITLRENTERPVTLRDHGGVSALAGNDPDRIAEAFHSMKDLGRLAARPPLWDGHTAERIVERFVEELRRT